VPLGQALLDGGEDLADHLAAVAPGGEMALDSTRKRIGGGA
jgi:hypothetical protein